MNNLVIPPSPNWYETSILSCAPDNTLIYGARNHIVIIYDSLYDQPCDIRIIHRAHSQKVISTSINKNWGHPHKLLVTVAEDNIIKLWDIETRKKKLGHNSHAGHSKVIGATFAGDDRIISVSEEGIIVIWNVILNQCNILKDIFGLKVTITCISTCPHANWLTAFGLKNGLVIVTDLRKQGKVLYKLRGHDKSVISLTWCPAPINIFPKDPKNYVGEKALNSNDKGESLEITKKSTENILETNSIEKFGNFKNEADTSVNSASALQTNKNRKLDKKNIWTNLKHADDDEHDMSNKVCNEVFEDAGVIDFLKECQNLKDIITGKSTLSTTNEVEVKDRVTLKAKRNQKYSEQTHETSNEKNVNTNSNQGVIQTESNHEVNNEQDYLEDKGDDQLPPNKKIVNKTDNVEAEKKDCVCTSSENVEHKEIKDKQSSEGSTENTNEDIEVLGDESNKKINIEDDSEDKIIDIKPSQELTGKLFKIILNRSDRTETPKESIKCEPEKVDEDNNSFNHNKLTCEEAKREIPVNLTQEEEPRREFLLASSGKEGNIYIWRAGTDGRLQTFFSLPNKSGHRRSNKASYEKLWTVLCWITPTVLLSSSKSAELLKWTLPKPKDINKQFTVVHNDHNSMLFSIAAPVVLLNEHNWLQERELNAWTVGHDRLLLNTTVMKERKNLTCYSTIGNAEYFALSPLDPNRLAIGTAEGTIKIWDLSRPHTKNIVMTNFFQRIQGKVVVLAWHPTNELILAYGTVEGRVGFMDVNKPSKTPVLMPHFFKSQIHNLEWGPVNGSKEDFELYAVAEGKLVIFSTQKSGKTPEIVDTPDDTFVYTSAWKPDYTMLLVGTVTGAVIVYSTELKILSTHYFQHKLRDIYWHPNASESDPKCSPYCYWFAAVSNAKDVIICDFKTDVKEEDKIVAKYEVSEDVNWVAWSPYYSSELVVASDDGIAQVWNVESNSFKSTYTSPNFEGILCTIWSPINSDYIISAVKDHTIRIWKVSDYPKRDIKEIRDLRKDVIKQITNEQNDLLPKVEKSQEELTKSKKTAKISLLPNFYCPKDQTQLIGDLRKLFLWKEGSNNAEIGSGDNNTDILRIFGSKTDMLDIIDQNETYLQERGKYGLSNTLSLFKGDISTQIKRAIDEKRVNPWIIMISPMVSPKLWQTACEVYAQQLSETTDCNPVEVATFYLACHKIEEAIEALCQGALFREALALAKCRLPEDSPTITTVLNNWIKYSMTTGNFEAAAQCYIFLGKYEDAASVLFRRSDAETLKFALELAEKSGNEELYKSVSFRYNVFGDKKNNSEEEVLELPSRLDVVLQQLNGLKDEDLNKSVPSNSNGVELQEHTQENGGSVLEDTHRIGLSSENSIETTDLITTKITGTENDLSNCIDINK